MTRFTTVTDPKLSLWQSAVTEAHGHLLTHQVNGVESSVLDHSKVHAAKEHVTHQSYYSQKKFKSLSKKLKALGKDAYLSHVMYNLANAKYEDNTKKVESLEKVIRKYSTADIEGWLTCVTTYLGYLYEKETPYYRSWNDFGPIDQYGVIKYKLPNNAKVALIADWGTGMPDAKAMVKSILEEHKPDVIIHLGDIYYSGTLKECRQHFVDIFHELFREISMEPIPVFSIPGNHEYYAFGDGFYHNVIDVINSEDSNWKQEASYFCLRTEDNGWQFLGMDTGRNDNNPLTDYLKLNTTWLEESEVDWHHDKLNHFNGSTILLSHHQLFSQHQMVQRKRSQPTWMNDNLYRPFSAYFDKISAWYWGHEHNLSLFKDDTQGLKKGRLIGCSAFEEMGGDSPYKSYNRKHEKNVPYIKNMPRLTKKEGYYYHGYAVLDFSVRKHHRDDILCKYYEFPSWGDLTPPKTELKSTQIYEEIVPFCK